MTRKKFYRVEDNDGDGFYRGVFYTAPPFYAPKNHPLPAADKVEFTPDIHIFGFKSQRFLKNWFYPQFVSKISRQLSDVEQEWGRKLFVSEYDSKNRIDGNSQSVSRREDLILIKRTPFKEFFKKDIDRVSKNC